MRELARNSRFRRLLSGRIITNIGDSLYIIAALWLVHEMSSSPLYTGIAGFLSFLPTGLQFLTGPIVDQRSTKWVLVVTQAVQGICVLSIPVAAWFGHLSVELILFLIPILSMLNQFVYPAQNAVLPQIVEEEHLVRANSIFSFAYSGVDLVFNAIGGFLIAIVGAVSLYVVDSITFFVALVLFWSIRFPVSESSSNDGDDESGGFESYVEDLRGGFEYLRGSLISDIVLTAAIANLMLGITMAVLPGFSDIQGGAGTYGLMLAASAGGTLVGTVAASVFEQKPFGYVSIVGFAAGCCLWLGSVVVDWNVAMVALYAAAWIPAGIFSVTIYSLIQSTVEEAMIGRVSSTTTSAANIMLPVGSLLGGVGSDAIGPVAMMAIAPAGFGFVAMYFWIQPSLRGLPSVERMDASHLGLDDTTPQTER